MILYVYMYIFMYTYIYNSESLHSNPLFSIFLESRFCKRRSFFHSVWCWPGYSNLTQRCRNSELLHGSPSLRTRSDCINPIYPLYLISTPLILWKIVDISTDPAVGPAFFRRWIAERHRLPGRAIWSALWIWIPRTLRRDLMKRW